MDFIQGRNMSMDSIGAEATRTIVLLEPKAKEIDLNIDFDCNAKMLAQIDVKILQDTLDSLARHASKDGLLK